MSYHYYDTCIFELSVNLMDRNYSHCSFITDCSNIVWDVCTCPDIIASEASIDELLLAFEIECARNGVNYLKISLDDAKAAGRQCAAEKRQLRQFGFSGNDWFHLCAAKAVPSAALVTCDEDFFDPSNKACRGAKKLKSRVKQFIKDRFAIVVIKPDRCPI